MGGWWAAPGWRRGGLVGFWLAVVGGLGALGVVVTAVAVTAAFGAGVASVAAATFAAVVLLAVAVTVNGGGPAASIAVAATLVLVLAGAITTERTDDGLWALDLVAPQVMAMFALGLLLFIRMATASRARLHGHGLPPSEHTDGPTGL